MNRAVHNDPCNVTMKRGNTEKEDFIDFTELPSLKHMATVSVAINLWEEPDMMKAVKEQSQQYSLTSNQDNGENDFQKLVDKVQEKLTKVFMPRSLITDVSEVVRPIGLELLQSFKKRNKYPEMYEAAKIGHVLCWTVEGVVDEFNSLKNKNSENNDFNELCRKMIRETDDSQPLPSLVLHGTILRLIINDRCLESLNVDIDPKDKIFMSILFRSLYGVKHYWTKVSEKEKNENIDFWLRSLLRLQEISLQHHKYQEYNANTDVMCFLLSDSRRRQKNFFQTYPEKILKSLFFVWPFEKFFVPTIKVMFQYLTEDIYINIMTMVANEIRLDRKNHQLFRTSWLHSPLKLKDAYLRDVTRMSKAIWRLLVVEDLRTIELMLTTASPELKKEVVSNMINLEHKSLFYDIVNANKLNLLGTLIPKVLSNIDIKVFEENVFSVFGHKFTLQAASTPKL